MSELVYRLEPAQLGRMRTAAVVLVPIGIAFAVAAVLWSWPWAPAALPLVFGVGSGVAYLGQRTAVTRVDDWGIRARLIFRVVREAPWEKIAEVTVQPRTSGQVVVVVPRSGTPFSLAAPVHTALFPDPEFDRKVARIRAAADQAQR